ncbi:Serine/threonine-protein phosphatase 7 long form [Glycine soja]
MGTATHPAGTASPSGDTPSWYGHVGLAHGAGETAIHVKFSFSGLQASALHCLGMQQHLAMASSSSSSSHVNIKSGPIDADVLWMQPKHVSEHVWNGEEDRKLHIRRAVPTKMAAGNTYLSHEMRRMYYYSPRRLCIVRPQEDEIRGSVVKLSWLAHHFAQINNDDDEEQVRRFARAWILRFIGGVLFVDKSSNKVSLRYLQFLRDFEECGRYAWGAAVLGFLYREMCNATDYKTKSIGGMCILLQMWAWERCPTLAPKRTPSQVENTPLGHRWLRCGNQHIGNDDVRVFRRKLDIMKRHEFVWEPYPSTVISLLPPVCLVGSLAWYAVVPLICFQVIEWHQPDRVLRQFGMQQPIPESPSQPLNIHGITLKGKHDENWGQLFAPMIDQWNNRHAFRVDAYPRQEGLLSFNSDYMVWYRRKTKMFVDPANAKTATLGEVAEALQYMVSPQGRNTCTFNDLVPYVEKITILSEEQERVTEPVSHGPASECQFPAQQFHMLQSSIETQGIDRRRDTVEAEEYSQQMAERGHGMYYTPQTFAEYPTQMYQYPFQGHHTNTSASQQSFGGVAETQAHFSWPTMTPSQQYHGPIPTPNAPLGTQWNVPGQIPNTGDLFGVDLRHAFSAEADEEEAGRHRGRRNPDRQARRWDRPCGTSSRHHGHQNE